MILFCSYAVSLFIRQVWTGPHIAFFNFLFSLIRSIAEWHKHAIYLFIYFLLMWKSLNHRPLRLIEGHWTAIREVKSQWVCGVRHAVQWRGGEGRKDITESYRGDQVQFIMKEPKPSCPHPLPQVMNNDRPPFIYLFIVFFLNSFITFIYLFIFYYFFLLRKNTRSYFTWHI